MGHDVSWIVEDRVILHRHLDTLTAEDMISVSDVSLEMLSNAESAVHVIADLTDLNGLHPDLMNVGNLRKLSNTFIKHENLGSLVIYGTDNCTVKFLASVLFQTMKKECRIVDDRASAIASLKRLDPTLEQALEAQ